MTQKVFLQTFGCQMNLADSDEMFNHLRARGAQKAQTPEEADIILVNTCTVREHAEHRAVSFLGRLAKWKKERPGRIIIFAGCAAQRLGNQLKKEFPFLDIVAGAKSMDTFSALLDKSGLFPPAQEVLPPQTEGLTGYVTIMRGCDFRCTYCIVPYVRGGVKCLPHEQILQEAAQKAAQGAKEIMLLGQTVNAYRDGAVSFADLLNRVSQVPGVERVRFMSPHPAYITPDFLAAVRDNPKIAKHIHLPIQSGSTAVLQAMKRGYTREILLEKLAALKACGMTVSTDIIVGFPTETEQDFQDTLTLVDEARFFAAYCFKYSPRQGTPAAQMELLPEQTLEERLDILLNKVRDLSARAYTAQVGTHQQVLMETENKGRTSNNFWVKTTKNYKIGSVVPVEITRADGTLLFAKE